MFLMKIVVVINLIKMVEKDMIKAQIMKTKLTNYVKKLG
jgi:hypothetical protein